MIRMQVEQSPIEYWRLSYLEYLIKPLLLIENIYSHLFPSPVSLESKHQIANLFESLVMTLIQLIDRLNPVQRQKPLKQQSYKIKRLFSLLLIMWKQTTTERDLWVQFLTSLKGNCTMFTAELEQQLMMHFSPFTVDIKLIFQYYKQTSQFKKLKRSSNLINQYNTDWINKQLAEELNQNVNETIKEKILQHIKDVSVVCRKGLPEEFLMFYPNQSRKMIVEESNIYENNTSNQRFESVMQLNSTDYSPPKISQFKLSVFLAKVDLQTRIEYLKQKVANLAQFISEDQAMYKNYIKQILIKHKLKVTGQQKSILYRLLLIIRVVEFSNYHNNEVSNSILQDLESAYLQLRDDQFELPLKSTIQFMGALSYLQNFISPSHYHLFHKLISSIMKSNQKQKQNKQYHTLVVFVTFFSFKMSNSNDPVNFTKLWKKIIEGDVEDFVSNICSIHFINLIIAFNAKVMAKSNEGPELLGGINYDQLFMDELSDIKNINIQMKEFIPSSKMMQLIERKRQISKLVNSLQQTKYDEATIQISKYHLINNQIEPFFDQLMLNTTNAYFQRLTSTSVHSTLTTNLQLFKLLSIFLSTKKYYICALICVELEDQKLNRKKFLNIHKMLEKTREKDVVHEEYLKFCSAQLLKILLKYCRKTNQNEIAELIIKQIVQPSSYQYQTFAKKGRTRIERQYQLIKWIYPLFTGK